MFVPVCNDAITVDAKGVAECASGWVSLDDTAYTQQATQSTGLEADEYQELYQWIFLIFALVFGIKIVLKLLASEASRHA